jgi:hypothetical protein
MLRNKMNHDIALTHPSSQTQRTLCYHHIRSQGCPSKYEQFFFLWKTLYQVKTSLIEMESVNFLKVVDVW